MNDVVFMQIIDTFEKLPEEAFDCINSSALIQIDVVLEVSYLGFWRT